MHDPCTQAFVIRWPWGRKRTLGNGTTYRYRESIITIWHVDPERDARKRGLRGDDSCGWFTPPTTPEERELVQKIGREEFSCLFRFRWATINGKSYADVCYEPTTYDAVYWAWRRLKRETARWRPVWKFGAGGPYLTRRELWEVYRLASNPVDCLQRTVATVGSEEDCGEFFLTVYRALKRYQRPWYRHPRWHVWHWRLQVHPWRSLRRWLFTRCAHCGKCFTYGESPISFSWHSPPTPWFGSEPGLYHEVCANVVHYARREAEDAKREGRVH